MKKVTAIVVCLIFVTMFSTRNEAKLVTIGTNLTPVKLSKVMELKLLREGGANAASVVYLPKLKKYIASKAGNANFQMGVFDENGHILTEQSQSALIDIRGLWYNASKNSVQGNGYGATGWFEYKLGSDGIPTDVKVLKEGSHQPDDQSVGAYDAKNNVVYFMDYYNKSVARYNGKSAKKEGFVLLHLGLATLDNGSMNETDIKNYNSTAVVYTGIEGSEIGLLNFEQHRIELYNVKNGLMTKVLELPEDAPAQDTMNFAYCNGIYWLFDTNSLVWKGYR